MFSLKGKKALVTGATGGLGAAIARALHHQGAIITLSGTRLENLEALASELGSHVHVLGCNLSDRVPVTGLISQAENKMEGLDILINNAGITKDMLAMRMKDEDWDQVLAINLTASFILSREAIKVMMRNRWGRIINISSVVGTTGNPGQANYCASKAGLVGMSKAMAIEMASRGITINCIAPGFIETAMTDKLNDQQKEMIMGKIPCQRMGSPEDIANTAVFLASEEASYITGQTLHVNGGMAMI